MNTIVAIFPFLCAILFIFSGRFVTSSETQNEHYEPTVGEQLFLAIFGLDGTLPCELCGDPDGNLHTETSTFFSPATKPSEPDIDWSINYCNWLGCFNRWFVEARDWLVNVIHWLNESLGLNTFFLLAILSTVKAIIITVFLARKCRAIYRSKITDKNTGEIHHSKRRKIQVTEHGPVFRKPETSTISAQETGTLRLTEMCIKALKECTSDIGETIDRGVKKTVKPQDKVRKIHKDNLKRSKQQKSVHILMKKRKLSPRGEIGKDHSKRVSQKDEAIMQQLCHVGLGSLGTNSTRKQGKCKYAQWNSWISPGLWSPLIDVNDHKKSSQEKKYNSKAYRSPTQSESAPLFSTANDKICDKRLEFEEGPQEFDLFDGFGPPRASSSFVNDVGYASDSALPEYLDDSFMSSKMEENSFRESLYGWIPRMNWSRYRPSLEMPWLNSFTQNSFLDSSFLQDSMDLSELHDSMHMYGDDAAKDFLGALWVVKSVFNKGLEWYRKRQSKAETDQSNNCHEEEYSSSQSLNESTEI